MQREILDQGANIRTNSTRMDLRRIEDLLAGIESAAAQIEAQDASLASYTGQVRQFVKQLRAEVTPPPDDARPKTRDEISIREWAEYEWHDVTTFGDKQRKYIRGLKR